MCYSVNEVCPDCGDGDEDAALNNKCLCPNQHSNDKDANSFGRMVMGIEEGTDNEVEQCDMSNVTNTYWDGNNTEILMYDPYASGATATSAEKAMMDVRNTWHCRDCPVGASCTGKRTGEQVGVRFGFWRSYWNTSLVLPCDVPEACLGEADPTYAWYREMKGDYDKRENVMYLRVPTKREAKADAVYGKSFCSNGLDARDYNCSQYRYGVKWMTDDEIGNTTGAFVDLALRDNTGTRCNSEAGYAEQCSALIEAKDLNEDGTLMDPNRPSVQCRKCTRCVQNNSVDNPNQRYGRGNWIRNDCVKCGVQAPDDPINPSLVSMMLLACGFIAMSTWTLSQNTSNHRTANFFVMQKAKSKFMAKMLSRKKTEGGAAGALSMFGGGGGGGGSGTKTGSIGPPLSGLGAVGNVGAAGVAGAHGAHNGALGAMFGGSQIVPAGKKDPMLSLNKKLRSKGNTARSTASNRLTRVEKIKRKKILDKAKMDGDMGSANEDARVGSISMTKILMNHIHMMSMIPLFDSNFLTNLNKTFFNSVGSIFGLYTGSAIECYFDYDEMFPLVEKRALLFMVSPFIVVFIVGMLWLPLHFFQDHKKTYYGSMFTKMIALLVTVVDMLYPVLTLETLKLLPCTTIFQAENECDSRKFMMIDLDIECGRDVRHSRIFYGYGIPMLWIYVIGIPMFALFVIVTHRKVLNSPKTHIRLNAIMAGFKLNKKWWSVIVMIRKAMFITAAIMFKDYGPFLQIFSGAFVVCIFTYLHFTNAPYVLVWEGVDEETCEYVENTKTDILHQMEGSSLMIELITLFCMLIMTDARAGEVHELKVLLGIFMFCINMLHMLRMMQQVLYRAHRENKLGKRASRFLQKSMVARRVVTNAIEDVAETISEKVVLAAASTFDVVSGRKAKRKREEKKKQAALTKVTPMKEIPSEKIEEEKEQLMDHKPTVTEIPLSSLTLGELRRVYRHFDADSDGMVDKEEVKRMMDHATRTYSGMEMPSAETDADEFVKLLDTDGDGVISEAEFVQFLEKYRGFDHDQREEFGRQNESDRKIGAFVQKLIVVAREKYGVDRNAGTFVLNKATALTMIELSTTLEGLQDVTREQVRNVMQEYIEHLDKHEGTDDERRGDHILADLADSLAPFEGEYSNLMNAVQHAMGLLNTTAYDEKRLELMRRQRKGKEIKSNMLSRQPTTIFGYDNSGTQVEDQERQQKAKAALEEIKRQEEQRLEAAAQEKAKILQEQQREAKEKADKVLELEQGKKAMAKIANITDPDELAVQLDDLDSLPAHVMKAIAKEIAIEKARLVQLSKTLSDEEKNKIVQERVANAKQQLQGHMDKAVVDVEALQSQLRAVKGDPALANALGDAIAR